MYKKGRPIDLKIWAKEMVKDWPEQENTADCGMFVVKVVVVVVYCLRLLSTLFIY